MKYTKAKLERMLSLLLDRSVFIPCKHCICSDDKGHCEYLFAGSCPQSICAKLERLADEAAKKGGVK
ncbi:MAG: hypothetical protein WC455_11670 [Dehalococcoidia bacterium]|jgi:hypothetical protein